MRKCVSTFAVVLGFVLLADTSVSAQSNYPTKPVTIIVPAAPGGVTDALGRVLAKQFTEAWGQQVIVENKPGANNQIAAEYVAKSPNDGTVLFIGPEVTFTVNPRPLSEARLRSGEGFLADHRPRHHQPRADPESAGAGEGCQGADRTCEAEAGRSELRQLRHRFERPSQHGDVSDARRGEADACAVQGRPRRRSPT